MFMHNDTVTFRCFRYVTIISIKMLIVSQGMKTEEITGQQLSTFFDNMYNITFYLLMQVC